MSLIPTSLQSTLSFDNLPLRARPLSSEALTNVMGGGRCCKTHLLDCIKDSECCGKLYCSRLYYSNGYHGGICLGSY